MSGMQLLPKTVKIVHLQMKTHSFDQADSISVLGFLTPFKLPRDANCILKDAAMWAMPHFVADRAASFLNSRMIQCNGTKGIEPTVNSRRGTLQSLRLQSYLEDKDHFP